MQEFSELAALARLTAMSKVESRLQPVDCLFCSKVSPLANQAATPTSAPCVPLVGTKLSELNMRYSGAVICYW